MKRYLFWLRTEYKRAAAVLPSMLVKAVILAVMAGMIAFCAGRLLFNKEDAPPVRIGYTASEDRLTGMAVSFVENMESVKSWCSLIKVEKEEGLTMLAQGDLAALLVLPDNIVEGILTGSNEPARLYLSKQAAPAGLVFEELAGAATGLLRTAQGEIYATHTLTSFFEVDEQALDAMYNEIDRFNLKLVMEREQYFRMKKLSVTDGEGLAVYYGSAFFTVYLLLAGLLCGRYHKRSPMEQRMLSKRAGIPESAQLLGRVLVSAGLLLAALFPLGLLWLFQDMRQILPVAFTIKSLLLVLLAVICVASGLLLLYQLSASHRTAVLPVGMAALFMGYASGCFLPMSLLPRIVEKAAVFLPSTYIKMAFTMVFSGETQGFAKAAAALAVFAVSFLTVGRLAQWAVCSKLQEHRGLMDTVRIPDRKKPVKGSDLFCIMAKRLLSQKVLWITLLVTVPVSLVMVKAEKKSDTAVYAAVYTKDETYRTLFSEYEGLVKFVLCDSEEDLKRNVVQGKAECGYVLQEDLQNKILSQDGSWSITVYENADSTLTRVVNEVLFERVFYAISSGWYEGYIAENENFSDELNLIGEDKLKQEARNALDQKLTDGSTFTFERQTISAGTNETERKASYPVKAVAAAGILLCGLIGVMEAVADKKEHRFPKRPAALTAFFEICQPVLCGAVMGAALLCWTKSMENPIRSVGFLGILSLLVIAMGMGLQWGIGKIIVKR